ncbi:MAG: hypothetical protein J5857_01235 [Treponema sp.]|nr:hypothetical protein [Treponema sp.]
MKIRLLILSVCLLIVFSSCSSKSKENAIAQNDVTSESITPINSLFADNNPPPQDNMAIPEDEDSDVDLDLTNKSATFVYSQIFNMLCVPEEYQGKKIRIKGQSYYYTNDFGDNGYSCIVMDATACCAQGLEFEPVAGVTKPKDDQEIIVTGNFEVYEYHGYDSFRLSNATVQLAKK